MKNILIYIVLILMLAACDNREAVFPDYELQAVYFPIQLPLRTLSLGEDRIDNTLDREHALDIGVCIGGMYKNYRDWTVDYVVDNTLTDNAYTDKDLKLIALPESYYTLTPINTVIIPKGSFTGLIRVQLSDQFFNDPLALTGQYVIPLRITGTSADSVLSGKPISSSIDADRRILQHWEAGKAPKDWVLYGIKYVNAYHGAYLHRGMNIRLDGGGEPLDTVVFRESSVVFDQVVNLTTMSLQKVYTNFIANKKSQIGRYAMELEFDNDNGSSGQIVITPREKSRWAVTGTGEYIDKEHSHEVWTELTWQCMYLKYQYNDGHNDHVVYDTLVFRDRGIKYEENTIVIK